MAVLRRNNVKVSGTGQQAMMFAHGFGCDQHMWRLVAPAFENAYEVVLFDHVGAGGSDLAAYHPARYRTLQGYADDVLDICEALDVRGCVYVGHSVAAMIGVLAAIKAPERFAKLILIGPSPNYINDSGYIGGFERADIEELLEFMDTNYLGWSGMMAPAIMGNAHRPELSAELETSFCHTDHGIAKQWARTTFLSDNRADLRNVTTPSLIVQCKEDVIAPQPVGEYVHRQIAGSTFTLLDATGHCPHLSAPNETIAAMRAYLG